MKLFPDYYDAGKVAQVAILLWEGWGYNLFKVENQLRADSLLIRSKGSEILGRATASMKAAETAYRKEKLPLPTRAKPTPDADAVAGAATIEGLVKEVGRIESGLRAAPAPEVDKLHKRFQEERDLLTRLVESDKATVGKAEIFRSTVAGKNGQWLIDNATEINEALASLSASITARADLLTV